MSESKEIALADFSDIGALIDGVDANPYVDEQALREVTKVGSWLPYLKLLDGNNPEVKAKRQELGTFAFVKNKNMINLGEEFACMVFAWRPKAMIFGSPPTAYFDTQSESFKEIQATADEKDSGKGYGPEVLLWIPDHKEFVTYFLGSKTGRNEAPNLIALIEAKTYRAKLKVNPITSPKYTWFGPKTSGTDIEMTMPPRDLLVDTLQTFNNPPKAVQEIEATGDDR